VQNRRKEKCQTNKRKKKNKLKVAPTTTTKETNEGKKYFCFFSGINIVFY